jgi:hypothetical protein
MFEVKGWAVKGIELEPDTFGALTPDEMLYEFDDCKIYIAHHNRRPLFVYTSAVDYDNQIIRTLVVPTSNDMVVKLKTGELSVCDMMRSPWFHIVDWDFVGETIMNVEYIEGGLARIPEGFKPIEGTLISAELEAAKRERELLQK